jgi:hypothetical protein
METLRVKRAAIRRDGKVLAEGHNHAECIAKAIKSDGTMRGFEEGFTLTDGRFVYRDEAFTVAAKAGQLRPSYKAANCLSSYMIKEWPE